MRELTEKQQLALERIAESVASANVKIVGWAANGPILQVKRGRLAALLPDGRLLGVAS